MTKQVWSVAVDIRKCYHITVKANTELEALRLAEEMQSSEIQERGSLRDVETSAVCATLETTAERKPNDAK